MSFIVRPFPCRQILSETIVVTATINHAWKAKKTDFSMAKTQMQNDVEGSKFFVFRLVFFAIEQPLLLHNLEA